MYGGKPATAAPPLELQAPADWSRAVVDSTMKRYTSATLGGWSYTRGLYLYGQYLVYKRAGEQKYFDYLKAPNGLLWHAYDKDGSEPWARNPGKHSAEHWARAIGWFGMAAIDILEVLPANHPKRADLIGIVQHLAVGYPRYRTRPPGAGSRSSTRAPTRGTGPRRRRRRCTRSCCRAASNAATSTRATGRWPSYRAVAAKGYQGVPAKASAGSDGLTDIKDISEGTNVGDAAYYFARPRNTNDFHGLGAFLIMNEQLARVTG